MKIKAYLFATILIWLMTPNSYAFKPTAAHGHAGITQEGMETISRVDSRGRILTFSDKAILEVRKANADTDAFGIGGGGWQPAFHCDDELLRECTQRLIDLKAETINALKLSKPDGTLARKLTEQALHTLQDFYSHSNWVMVSGAVKHPSLGRAVLSNPSSTDDFCQRGFGFQGAGLYNAVGQTTLTSGYFTNLGLSDSPDGKCHHGISVTLPYTNRMSKDWPGADYRLQGTHAQARLAAVSSTTDFVEQILNAPGVAGNDEAIRAYMGIHGSLGFAIDNTGSMGSVIAGVRSVVSQIVSVVDTADTKPDQYVLVTFNDPYVSSAFVTDSAANLSAAVNSIYVGGGGDCPEYALTGIERVVDAASVGSQVLMFTDASAKDSNRWPTVAAKAKVKNIKISTVASGSCSPIDPAYYALASETGGQLIETYRTSAETVKVFDIARPLLTGNVATMFVARGSQPAGLMQEFSLPVDESSEKIVLSIASDNMLSSTIELYRPDATLVTDDQPNTVITQVKGSRIYTVNAPQTGLWQLRILDSGNYFVNVDAVSPITFADFSFVNLAGRSAHQGLFPIDGAPVSDEPAQAVATIFGELSDMELVLINEAGLPISRFPFDTEEDIAQWQYYKVFNLPNERFRAQVLAKTASGQNIMRTFPGSFLNRSVKVVAISSGFTQVLAGSDYSQRFEVHNIGAEDNYHVQPSATLSSILQVSPSSFNLKEGQKTLVELTLRVPANAQIGQTDTLSLLVQGMVSDNASVVTTIVGEAGITGDFDHDGDIDIDDLNILMVVKNMPASGASDIRDLDGNGVIDVVDVRLLTRMCTRAQCARE